MGNKRIRWAASMYAREAHLRDVLELGKTAVGIIRGCIGGGHL